MPHARAQACARYDARTSRPQRYAVCATRIVRYVAAQKQQRSSIDCLPHEARALREWRERRIQRMMAQRRVAPNAMSALRARQAKRRYVLSLHERHCRSARHGAEQQPAREKRYAAARERAAARRSPDAHRLRARYAVDDAAIQH